MNICYGNNKVRDDFSDMMNKFDVTDMFRSSFQMNIECILFSNTYEIVINDDDIFDPPNFLKL